MTSDASNEIKAEAHRLIDTLPVDATWDDIMYRLYVRQCVASGVADADTQRVIEVNDVRRQFGLMPRES
jgi:hypothetical protein